MMNQIKIFLTCTLVFFCFLRSQAQPPGGGGPRMSPKDRILREKQNLYSKVEGLTEDQKLIIDSIYDEFAMTIEEAREEIRRSGDREAMRTKMEALRKEKDELMRDILTDKQYLIYAEMGEAQRERMEERRKQREDNGEQTIEE